MSSSAIVGYFLTSVDNFTNSLHSFFLFIFFFPLAPSSSGYILSSCNISCASFGVIGHTLKLTSFMISVYIPPLPTTSAWPKLGSSLSPNNKLMPFVYSCMITPFACFICINFLNIFSTSFSFLMSRCTPPMSDLCNMCGEYTFIAIG